MDTEPSEVTASHGRWPLIRDVLVFECKLLVDGFRDLVLMPVSLLVGMVSIIGKGKGQPPGHEFYDLLHAARRTERWINLFGAVGKRNSGPTEAAEGRSAVAADLDALVDRVETFLVEEYRNGGVTAQAKARLDSALQALQKRRNRDQAL